MSRECQAVTNNNHFKQPRCGSGGYITTGANIESVLEINTQTGRVEHFAVVASCVFRARRKCLVQSNLRLQKQQSTTCVVPAIDGAVCLAEIHVTFGNALDVELQLHPKPLGVCVWPTENKFGAH